MGLVDVPEFDFFDVTRWGLYSLCDYNAINMSLFQSYFITLKITPEEQHICRTPAERNIIIQSQLLSADNLQKLLFLQIKLLF